MEPQSTSPKPILNIPIAIIVAGAIIAGTIIYSKQPAKNAGPSAQEIAAEKALQGVTDPQAIKPVTASDHILGNPNAKVKIVEYSDPSCPYCKLFHPTMRKIMETYGKGGDVAWVYRHYPLDKPDSQGRALHKNAGHEAQAMECAAELGGNDKFWAYTNRLYEVTPSVTGQTPEGLDQSELPNIAAYVGLDKTAFNTCLGSGRTKDLVEADYLDGINGGVEGTPYSFIITPTGKQIPVNGAQPYANIKNAIDALLADGATN